MPGLLKIFNDRICIIYLILILVVFSVGFIPAHGVLAEVQINQVPTKKLLAPDGLSELSVGVPDAEVTIVEYISMSCAACAKFHKTTYSELKKKYIDTGKVRFVMREFPLDNLAAAGAMLARCLNDNNKSVALISVLYSRQREWVSSQALEVLLEIAKQAGFSKVSFEACLKDGELLKKLRRRLDKADKEFGVNATPSFFINGKRLRSHTLSVEEFEKVIGPLLNKS